MSAGITDLDRMTAGDLALLHSHAVAMRDLVARRVNRSGPLHARLDSLVDDIEAARSFEQWDDTSKDEAQVYGDLCSLAEALWHHTPPEQWGDLIPATSREARAAANRILEIVR